MYPNYVVKDEFLTPGCARYKRDELGLRLAYFHCSAAASQFFGPLFASGVFAIMDEKLGYAAWR